ncbi:MAG: C40 family peptidase [Christensenellales bacterium]|nr:C40 family peptidase [Christensenellales bacterium]
MSKELKASDKVTQKMTHDGAVLENLSTGEVTNISERPQEENLTQPIGGTAEKVIHRVETEYTRHTSKKAAKQAYAAAQSKTHASRLQFTAEERATPELEKYIRKSDKKADKLDAARANIPKSRKIVKERVFDEAKGKAKTRLSFAETDKKPDSKLRHNPLSRPAQEFGNAVHGKIHEVERENVGVEAGHKAELAGEAAGGFVSRRVKSGIRSHKLKPYRAAAQAEKAAVKANADFLYQKALHDNPALAYSNPLSRFMQKQRIKRQYAKTLKTSRTVKKTADTAKKTAKKTAEATEKTTAFVVRHWKGCLIVVGIALVVFLLFSGLSSCSLFGGNTSGAVLASSYFSEDADMLGAEAAYTAMEEELRQRLENIESEYPDYDEYRFDLDEIEHDPYVLISILSAWHEGIFTLNEAQATLEMLFEKQYILTFMEEVEVRYRTETRTGSYTVTDPETGETTTEYYDYEVTVAYNYYILNVALENFNLSHVPVYIMGEDTLSMYAVYMSALGNRPDLFPQSEYIRKYITDPPAEYEVPAELLNSDEQFARLIEEAEKYLYYPYVWGGSNPRTSFDCSGFVSWVLTNSGLCDTGRLGAQGLCNISTLVSNPRPGDLVFFVGTYDTPGVSHVGIYVGEDGAGNPMMLHCGDPIQYSRLNTSYWQSHFYAYGRPDYN